MRTSCRPDGTWGLSLCSVLAAVVTTGAACSEETPPSPPPPELTFVAVTMNTGTTEGLDHDRDVDDGYTSAEAAISDMHYGDGLSWVPAVEAARAFFEDVSPDIAGFQEIFYSGDCEVIPPESHPGFVCESWSPGDLTVANVILGMGYQVACHQGKNDKCLAVKRSFGTFRGCDGDLCLDGLDGAEVMDCGSGSRVGRAVIDLEAGGALTVVNVHGTSGFADEDVGCRVSQFEQVFVDLDGEPAANGAANVILGDFNTDPGRVDESDPSAARVRDFAGTPGEGLPFSFVTGIGPRVEPTYAIFNIDHVISDAYTGDCWAAGKTEGHPPVYEPVYFDHVPIVCTLEGDLP